MELILERTELREDCTVGTLSVIKRVDDENSFMTHWSQELRNWMQKGAIPLPRPPPSQKGAMQW